MMIDPMVLGIAAAAVVFGIGMSLEARSRRRALGDVAPASTPPSVYPRINSDACICSGNCITACPEGDVLAMVGGRPRIVQPAACVSHGDCLRACPASAIELVIGSRERAVEVPVASGTFETTVPGLYVAGEVNGIGRIHVAVAQGQQAAAAALGDAFVDHGCELDLLVVGGGPAGIAAALEARRRGARYAIYEKAAFGGAILSYPRTKIVMTAPLDLPGVGLVPILRARKPELLGLFQHVAAQTSLAIVEHAEVTRIAPAGRGFVVESRRGSVSAHRVVLAIGRRGTPRRLDVVGGELPHVVYQVDEPAHYAGRAVVVVGGGDSALEVAVALASQPGTSVTLVHRGPDFGRCRPANRRRLEGSAITVLTDSQVRAVTSDHVVIATPTDHLAVPATAVVCCLGAELPAPWLRTLGIAIRELRGERLNPPRTGWPERVQ